MHTWFDKAWALMKEAFPPIERRTRAAQKALFSLSEFNMRIISQGDELIGFITWWDLPSCRFVEHLAVSPEHRGRRFGERLLKLACDDSKRPVVLEIEPPGESEQAAKRLLFYRRCGFVDNPFPYLQQPLKAGDEPIPLVVVSYEKALTDPEFIKIRRDIYRSVYGVEI